MLLKIKNPVVLSSLVLIFLLLTGLIIPTNRNNLKSLIPLNKITYIKGKIKSSPVKNSKGTYYSANFQVSELKSENQIYSGNGKITIMIPSKIVEAYMPGKMYTSSKQKNNYLYEEGGYYEFVGKYSNEVFYAEECKCGFWENTFTGTIYKLRAELRINFKRLLFSWKDAGGLFTALLTSSKEYTDKNVSENFRKAGLAHVLALSGMHLSLLSGLAVFIGNKTKRIRFSYFIRLTAISLFVFFAGFSPSLLRAFISFLILYIYSLCNIKKINMVEVLCLTFVIQVNISPQSISNAAFILSYSALFGILLLGQIFEKYYSKIFPLVLSKSFSSSTSAQLFTLPFSLRMFGSFAPVGILSTFIVSPLITIFMYSGLFLFIVSLIFPFLSQVSGIFMNFLYNVISYIVRLFAFVPVISIK